MGKLRDSWKTTKDNITKGIAVSGGALRHELNNEQINNLTGLLKSFGDGFGPALDTVESAYTKKKDPEAKKAAEAALKICEGYVGKVDHLGEKGIGKKPHADFFKKLHELDTKLHAVAGQGSAAKNIL